MCKRSLGQDYIVPDILQQLVQREFGRYGCEKDRHLNSMFHASHPSIHAFVDNLKKVQADTCIRTRHLDKPALIRKGAARKLRSAVKAGTDLESKQTGMKCLLHAEPWSQLSSYHHVNVWTRKVPTIAYLSIHDNDCFLTCLIK